MVVKLSLLLSSTLAVLPALVSAGTCPPKYALVASTVAQIPQAQSYCSSKYPLPVVTSTVSASTSTSTVVVTATVTSTAPAVTTTTTQQVTGATTITTSLTSTSTITVFTQTTSTFTSIIPPASPAARMLEREAHNEPVKASSTTTSCKTTSSQASNPKASVWSSLVSRATSILPTICTCIQTAKTTSTTVTPSTTITSTVTTTTVVSSTETATAQTTVTIVTAQATTTAAPITRTVTSTNTAVQTQYRFPARVVCNAAQRTSCSNNGGFTTGVLPCTVCAIFYIQETPVCLGQIIDAGQCTSDNYCQNVAGASGRCVFDPRDGNYGQSVCAITENCNRPRA